MRPLVAYGGVAPPAGISGVAQKYSYIPFCLLVVDFFLFPRAWMPSSSSALNFHRRLPPAPQYHPGNVSAFLLLLITAFFNVG